MKKPIKKAKPTKAKKPKPATIEQRLEAIECGIIALLTMVAAHDQPIIPPASYRYR
jgi:hypothetical protein